RLIIQVLEGLTAVHAAGVVHRDVKPENVLVDTTMTPSQARLSDFGIARLTRGPSLTRLTGLIGTPGYLAPELSEREHATPAAGAARALGAVATGLRGLQALPRLERPPDPEVPEPERATVLSPGRSGSRTVVDPGAGPGGESPGAASRRVPRRRLAIVAVLAVV